MAIQASYLPLIDDTAALPQLDLTGLKPDDVLVAETAQSMFWLQMELLHVLAGEPVWLARAKGEQWLESRYFFLMGANTAYHRTQDTEGTRLADIAFNSVVKHFPVVLGGIQGGYAVMGPVEHAWLNGQKHF